MQVAYQKINPSEIQFFRPLEQLMRVYCQTDRQYFCNLFQRKQEMINNFLSTGIDKDKYLALIAKIWKSQSSQKEFAKLDMLSLKEKHQMNKESWFQQIFNQIQVSLTDQQNKYNQYQAQNKVPQHSVNQQNVSSTSLNLNFTQFTNFKLFDEFMQKYYETPYRQTFIELYEKKLRIMQSIQAGKLKPQIYFEMSRKAFSQTKNDEVKKTLKTDLEMLTDLHDDNKDSWVKEAVKETKSQLSNQKEIYELHKKGEVVNKRQKKTDIDIDSLTQIHVPNVDPSECISFGILDQYMKQSKNNPELYIELYDKKQSLLKQVQEKKLNEKSYKQRLTSKKNMVQNQTLKEIYEIELNDIDAVHEGKEKQWFQHILDQTNINLMIQEDIYANFKLTYKPSPKKKPETKEKLQNELVKSKPQIKKQQQSKQKNDKSDHFPLFFNPQKMFNLKVIEDSILLHQKDNKVFTKLFTQKQKIIDMMKNGQLDADKYKKLQQKMLTQFANNEQVKEQINFDLQGINDFHEGDANQWFQEIVQRAGQYYEKQLMRYEQLIKSTQKEIKPKGSSQQIKELSPKPTKKVQKQEPTPFNIKKMFSLKTLEHALNEHQNNEALFMKIFAQKQKIIDMMRNGQLDAEKYKKLQQSLLVQFSQNEQIKDSIFFDLQQINDMYDGDVNKWFAEVVEGAGFVYETQLARYQQLQKKNSQQSSFSEKTQVPQKNSYSQKIKQQPSSKKQFDSKVSEAESYINQSTPKSKIRFYLHQMAIYESLSEYYKKHGINSSKNQMLNIYHMVPKQEIEQIIQKIKEDSDFDIISYCKKFFPHITSSIFYHGSQNYDEKLMQGIKACNKQIESLKEYTKFLRKGLNVRNLQKSNERIKQCQQNIKYLTDLGITINKSNKLIPLPLIEQVPVSYPKMDQFTHLDPNEVELKIIKIQGMNSQEIMKIYFLGNIINEIKMKNVTPNIVMKGKVDSAQDFTKILKGDLKCFKISLQKKGWFSVTKLGEEGVEMQFNRTNIQQGKLRVGKGTIFYEARVRIPKIPSLTEIKEVKITKYPPYEHSKQVESQFVARFTPTGKLK